jgi:hypothetical protein
MIIIDDSSTQKMTTTRWSWRPCTPSSSLPTTAVLRTCSAVKCKSPAYFPPEYACVCISLHVSVYVCGTSLHDHYDCSDSRTNPILKEGGDVMKRGRASLLNPLRCLSSVERSEDERDVVRTGEIRHKLWAREQVRKETRKGKSLRPLPKKRREQFWIMEVAATESSSRRSLLFACSFEHSFSERPDRNRTPIPESLQWLSTALCPTLTSH